MFPLQAVHRHANSGPAVDLLGEAEAVSFFDSPPLSHSPLQADPGPRGPGSWPDTSLDPDLAELMGRRPVRPVRLLQNLAS